MEIFFNILEYIRVNVEYNYINTILLFLIFMVTYFSLSLPGNVIFLAATGYFFGIYIGYIISMISIVFGSFIFFTFSQFFIKKLFPKIFNKYASNINKFISNSSLEYLIIFRMIPGPPLFIQNFLLSFLKINKKFFILSTFIGFTPIIFIIVYVGNQLNDIENIKNITYNDIFSFNFLIFIFFIIFLLIIKIFYKK